MDRRSMRHWLLSLALVGLLLPNCSSDEVAPKSSDVVEPSETVEHPDIHDDPSDTNEPDATVENDAAAPETVTPPDAEADSDEPPTDELLETRLDPVCGPEFCAAGPEHAPDPVLPGPFPVGVITVDLYDEAQVNDDGSPRWLRTEIWYPTTDEYADGPFVHYNLIDDAPPELEELLAGLAMDPLPTIAVRDTPVRQSDGPYPLVVFSHGAFGVRFQNAFQTVHLASHGYIVVSPDHQLNTTWDYLLHGYDPVAVAGAALPRIKDGGFLIDWMFAENDDSDSMFHEQVATRRVGVTGHSFGGFLSMVLGGIDERVSAVIPLAPAGTVAGIWPGTNLENYRVPCLIMGGDDDRTLQFDIDMWQPYERMAERKAFLRVIRGGHFSFTDMCSVDVATLAEDLGWDDARHALSDGCGDENLDPALVRELTNHYGTALFNVFLRRSLGSRTYLDASHLDASLDGEVEYHEAFDLADWPE